MFFSELVHSYIEIQMGLNSISTVNNDFNTVNIQSVFENFPKKQSVLNNTRPKSKVSGSQRYHASVRWHFFRVLNRLLSNTCEVV